MVKAGDVVEFQGVVDFFSSNMRLTTSNPIWFQWTTCGNPSFPAACVLPVYGVLHGALTDQCYGQPGY